MGSDCATRNQRSDGLAQPQRLKGSEEMDTPAQAPDASKLLAMTDNVVIRNQVYKRARKTCDEPREYGRLDKSVKDLQEAAEKFRKAGKAGQP
jgi:hypothetical protein